MGVCDFQDMVGLTHDKAIDSKWIGPDFLMRTTKSQQSREVLLRMHKPARTQNCAAVMRRFGALLVLLWWRAKGVPSCHMMCFVELSWTFAEGPDPIWGLLLGQAFCDLASVRRHVQAGRDCMRLVRHRQYWMHWRRAWKQHFDCGDGLYAFDILWCWCWWTLSKRCSYFNLGGVRWKVWGTIWTTWLGRSGMPQEGDPCSFPPSGKASLMRFWI